jgi:beta-glucosidase
LNSFEERLGALAKRLPSDFVVGTATSSWQIEGNLEGRGSSIWEDFARAGKIKDGSTGEPACDHVNRVGEDLELLKWLGVDSYRFSFSWPRIMRTGEGALNSEGIGFYDRLIDGLLERGIKPAATVYHWDLPSTFGDRGGWTWEPIADKFADYAAVLADKFADRVDSWATLNEPWVSAFLGYATDIHAPGAKDPARGLEAAYRLLLAHGRGIEALRANGAKNTGLVLNLTTMIAEDEGTLEAAKIMDGLQNRLFLDPVAGRGIPADVIEATKHITDWGFVKASELAEIATPIDWLGINYYTPNRIESPSETDKGFIVGQNTDVYPGMPDVTFVPQEPRTSMGWEIHASSMTTTLQETANRLPGVPLYVTENGGAFKDDELVEGHIDDQDRINYYLNHINAALDARDAGVDLRGFYAWSLFDNLEWAEGWKMTFGIVHVNQQTMERTPKASARMFKHLLELR